MFYLLGGDHAEAIPGAWVTDGFMQALGIRPAIGHSFAPDAFAPGGPNVALISHRFWITRFGSDPAVVGRTMTAYVSDRPQEAERFTVIGVLPANFWHINPYTDILAPLRAPTYPYLARLQPGVTAERAAERIGTLVRAGARNVPPNWTPTVVAMHAEYVQRTSSDVVDRRRGGGDGAAGRMRQRCRACCSSAPFDGRRRSRSAWRSAQARRQSPGCCSRKLSCSHSPPQPLPSWPASSSCECSPPRFSSSSAERRPAASARSPSTFRTLLAAAAIAGATALICTLAPLATSLRPGLQQRDAGRQSRHDGRPAQPAPPLRARGRRDRAVAHLARRIEPDAADGRRAAAHRSRLHRRARADRVDHAAAEPLSRRVLRGSPLSNGSSRALARSPAWSPSG